ncbi:MAG: 50S ribosomal protein L21 [Devosiaceae bacterium]|nr:50S ribosomal protein L21 [Devosiaceae bacterium]
MFAIIKTGGKQYKVAADDILQIEKLDAQAGETITFDQVLMLGQGSEVTIGSPLVEGATVVAELVEQFRNKKIIVFKKKRRKKYRRTQGHRQNLSLVKITDILAAGQKPAKKAAAKKTADKKPVAEKAPVTKKAPAASKTEKTDFVDDLKLISGVGPALEKKLHALDVKSLKDVAKLTKDDVTRIDEALSFKGRIDRDNWIQQAKDLVAGK